MTNSDVRLGTHPGDRTRKGLAALGLLLLQKAGLNRLAFRSQ